MNIKGFSGFLLLSFLLLFFCSRDQADQQALKSYYLNLTLVTDSYLRYLNAFKPESESTRRMQQEIMQPGIQLQNDLNDFRKRLALYEFINTRIDSMNQKEQKQELSALELQAQGLRRSLTTKLLIQRIILFIDEMAAQMKKINT